MSENADLGSDINYCIQFPVNVENSLNEFCILIIELNQSLESIWANIYHRTQDEIKSFTNNQVYRHQLITNLSNESLNENIGHYSRFVATKKIKPAEAYRLKAYNKAGILGV